MAQQPKRLPGERNPRGDVDAPMHVAREGLMADGLGSGGLGIGRAVSAMFDWWDRRKARRRH